MEIQRDDIFIKAKEEPGQLSSLSCEVVLSLLYFDVFNYPLNSSELIKHVRFEGVSQSVLEKELETLIQKKVVQVSKGFYYLNNQEQLVERRIVGNIKATDYIKKAYNISKFISKFPFVRGIFLSGSVAKGYADKDSDIDFFIVTSPNRLWLSRTLLILFKKTFLLNSKKYFCLNYFVDIDHLEIPDKNIFTAIELNYLLPQYNAKLAKEILDKNNWTKEYLPNFTSLFPLPLPLKDGFIKRTAEKILGGYIGNKLDDFCLSLTEKFWKLKFRNKLGAQSSSIRCKKYVSKFHPNSFQDKVLNKYEEKIVQFEQAYKIGLRP